MRLLSVKKIRLLALTAVTVAVITISAYLHRDKFITDINYIRLDTRKGLNESLIFQHISQEIPYLPIEDILNGTYNYRNINKTCAWYPTFHNIKIRNDYWQEFQNTNITHYIFGAYLDNRPTVVKDEPVVRILTMIHFFSPKDEDYPITYCQFWYEEQREPIIVAAEPLLRLWNYKWGHGSEHHYGHFLTCALPNEHKDWIPKTVSLVSAPCNTATNNVRVTYMPLKDDEVEQEFAICVKGADYPYEDKSHRLVEYFEIMRSLGVGKIVMYNLQVHPNVTKVLKYYEQTDFIEFRPLSSSSAVGNLPEYRHMGMTKNYWPYVLHEVIPYNDCLYRNMYRFKYIAVADIDEVLMPLANFSNWHDLIDFGEGLKDPNCKKFASFCFRCIYFPPYPEKPRYTHEFPEYFHMLQHVERVREHIRPDWATKCLHNTDRVIGLHNHLPFAVAPGVCRSYSFNATHAQMQHYREPPVKETLNDTVVDKSLWRFKGEVIERSLKVFEELDFFSRD